MNQNSRILSEEQRARLRAVITTYVRGKKKGKSGSLAEVLQKNADIAPEIQTWFDEQKRAHNRLNRKSAEPAVPQEETVLVGDAMPTGTQFGRYKLLRVLGKGAMGMVYLARDTKLDRDIALKTPNAEAAQTKEFMARFEREARTAAGLSHRNICRVFDAGEQDGVAYITMAYIDGRPLSDLIGTPDLRALDSIFRMTDAIADALQHAHEQNVVHRDLKPGNIMVNGDLDPFVTDFGLARQVAVGDATELTHEGAILGTPAYMAPEQIRGERDKVGPRSDIYSLGIILFRMLTGQLPFSGSLPDILAKSLLDDPPPPGRLRSGLSVAVDDLCLKMLKKDAALRFASMAEVRAAIGEIIEERAKPNRTESNAKAQAGKGYEVSKSRVQSLLKNGQYAAATRELEHFSQEDRPEYAPLSAWAKETLVQVRKETKAMTPDGLKALLQTARTMFETHDYRGCIQLLSDIPVLYRSNGIDQLLQKAMDTEANAEELMLQIRRKEQNEETQGLERLVKRFLKLKPQNKHARRLSAALQSYSHVSSGRRKYLFENGRLRAYEKQTFAGQWILKGAVVGLTVFAVMFVYVNSYLNKDDGSVGSRSPSVATAEPDDAELPDGGPGSGDSELNSQSAAPPVLSSTSSDFLAVAPYSFADAQRYQRASATQLGIPDTLTNKLGMTLKLVPAGRFMMGSPDSEESRAADEGPQREVTISRALYFQTTEVTEQQWKSVMSTEPWMRSKFNRSGPDYPARNMSHTQATKFCEQLSMMEDVTYRLPTEAEWEHACRAGSTSAWYCGDSVERMDGHAWWGGLIGKGNCKDEQYAHQVQQKTANAFGLYDVCGNVNEWCSDRYQEDYYENGATIDPTGPTSGDNFVVRGGAWVTSIDYTRCANRGFAPREMRRFGLGLRVVREVESASPRTAGDPSSQTAQVPNRTDSIQTVESNGLELNSQLTIISQIQGATEAQLGDWANRLPRGYRPYWISRRTTGTELRFDGLARRAPVDAEWKIDYFDLEKDFEHYESMRGAYRPSITNDCASEDNTRMQIVWVKDGVQFNNWIGTAEFVRGTMIDGFTESAAVPGSEQLLIPVNLSARFRKSANQTLYQVSQAMFAYPEFEFQHRLTAAEVKKQLPDYAGRNWQLHLLTGIADSPTQQFAAVFVDRGASRQPWSVTMHLSAEKYAEALMKVDTIGGWPRCVSSGRHKNGLTFHVVWDNVGNRKLAAINVVDGSY